MSLFSLLIHHHTVFFRTSTETLAKAHLLLPRGAERDFFPVSLLSIIRFPRLNLPETPCAKLSLSELYSTSKVLVLRAGPRLWCCTALSRPQSLAEQHGGG